MARLTELSFPAAELLLQEYGLELAELTPLEAGSVNSNFLLRTKDGGEYFARIYEEQGASGAAFELALNERLSQAGVPVARPLRARGGALSLSHANKPFSLYERIFGEVLCQKRITPEVTFALGQALGRVHTADLGDLIIPEGRFGIVQIEERLDRVEGSGRTDLLPAAQAVRALARRIQAARKSDLPSGLIHGDLFRDNTLLEFGQGGAPHFRALLDFESACRGPYVYDLMVTLLAWCFGDTLDPALTGSLLRGYESIRPLTPEERQNLVSEGSFACVRFATTRLTDFSLRTPPGLTPARDYGRFLKRLEALENGALAS